VTTYHQTHLQSQATKNQKYVNKYNKVIACIIMTINHQFTRLYSLMKGIKTFGEKGHQAAQDKVKQLHNHIYIQTYYH
jgi:uncharacterized pyridoxal phosphate-containing UPF0001 family protein